MTAPITPPNPFYVPRDREVTLSMDGTWRFAPDPDDRGEVDGWHRTGVQGRPCPVPVGWRHRHAVRSATKRSPPRAAVRW